MFSYLKSSEIFDFNGNRFLLSLPPELSQLSQLTVLNTDYCSISGVLPDISQFSNLRELYLRSNYLEEGLELDTIWSFKKLNHLDLSSSGLSLAGTIPGTTFGEMTDLVTFKMFENSLTGSIPSEIGKLKKLEEFDVGTNSLTGSLPTELGLCSSLKDINIDQNKFRGTVPTELLNIRHLDKLFLSQNAITGQISRNQCEAVTEIKHDSQVACPCEDSCKKFSALDGQA